jgi:hypothetical protein
VALQRLRLQESAMLPRLPRPDDIKLSCSRMWRPESDDPAIAVGASYHDMASKAHVNIILPIQSWSVGCAFSKTVRQRSVFTAHVFPSNNGGLPGSSRSALNRISVGHDATMRSPVTGKCLNGRGFLHTLRCLL